MPEITGVFRFLVNVLGLRAPQGKPHLLSIMPKRFWAQSSQLGELDQGERGIDK
jgi:hypothetical protein